MYVIISLALAIVSFLLGTKCSRQERVIARALKLVCDKHMESAEEFIRYAVDELYGDIE